MCTKTQKLLILFCSLSACRLTKTIPLLIIPVQQLTKAVLANHRSEIAIIGGFAIPIFAQGKIEINKKMLRKELSTMIILYASFFVADEYTDYQRYKEEIHCINKKTDMLNEKTDLLLKTQAELKEEFAKSSNADKKNFEILLKKINNLEKNIQESGNDIKNNGKSIKELSALQVELNKLLIKNINTTQLTKEGIQALHEELKNDGVFGLKNYFQSLFKKPTR